MLVERSLFFLNMLSAATSKDETIQNLSFCFVTFLPFQCLFILPGCHNLGV